MKAAEAAVAGESLAQAGVATPQGTPPMVLPSFADQVAQWIQHLDPDTRVEVKVALADGDTSRAEALLRAEGQRDYVWQAREHNDPHPDGEGAWANIGVAEAMDLLDGKGLDDADIEHFLDGGDYSPYDSWELDGDRGIEIVKVSNNDWVVQYTGRLAYEGPRFERHEYWDDARASVVDWAENAYESVNPRDIAQSFEESVEAGELDSWYQENAEWACNVKAIIEGRIVDPHEIYDDHWWVGVPVLSFEDKVHLRKSGWDAHTAHLAMQAGVTVETAHNYDPSDPDAVAAWRTLAALRN